jgi:hypothetical protein
MKEKYNVIQDLGDGSNSVSVVYLTTEEYEQLMQEDIPCSIQIEPFREKELTFQELLELIENHNNWN